MSNGVKATNAISIAGGKAIRLAIGRFARFVSGNGKEDPTSRQSRTLYSSAGAQDADELSREVYPLICATRDDCMWPQETLFNFAKDAVDRRERSTSHAIAEPLPAADGRKLLQEAVLTLDLEARKVLDLHVNHDKTFREIARHLNLPEERVIKILGVAYARVRKLTLPSKDELLPAAPSRESLPE